MQNLWQNHKSLFPAAGLFLMVASLVCFVPSVHASGLFDDPTPTPELGNNPHQAGDCLGCHGLPGMKGRTENDEVVSLYIQPAEHEVNFHTQAGVGCKFCHVEQGEYPHASSSFSTCAGCHGLNNQTVDLNAELIFNLPYKDTRDFTLSFNNACAQCHQEQYKQVEESIHTKIRMEGNKFAPVCVDCHSAHNITEANRGTLSQICSKCHQQQYNQYKTSVHGAALETNGNPDVPTCGGCHGSHAVKGPSNSDFRQIAATEICGKCHSDSSIMDKYGISTDVLGTYMDDVHGKTNLMGKVNRLDSVKATCYDCHGVHDILSPQNPYSKVYPSNLQATCAQCHKDANINFPAAWLSHKKPEQKTMPLLYAVNNYSLGVVLAVVLLVLLWIILDLRRANEVQIQKYEEPESLD